MKIVCIGRNYAAHVRELNNAMPDEPVIFIKPDTAVLRNNAPFFIPEFTQDVHHEIEVVVKINKNGKSIPVQFAADYYDEITLGIDFTARDLQSKLKEKGLPWEKAKGFDHSAVIGKFIPKTGLDMKNLDFHLTKNGETVQKGNTQMMMHSVDEVIAHVSQYFMLKTGDLIFTGTPEGVGPVSAGDELKGFLGDTQLFRCGVR
ncbi:MAG: fumarylacetoacetate hydrolase family protein [Sphingomonadales bacterium]|jgi:2-keto-4-pentenoate hydratase/2-oxohepta-3-ene-1,7-dioic acid hydratase in catechol pathway